VSKRKITIDDLLALKWVSDPQLSHDGSRLVFVQTVVDRDADTYRSHLWVAPVDGGALRQFTAGEHRDSLPRWSPDGRRIAFLSDRGTAKPDPGVKRPKQIFVIPADGGEARLLVPAAYHPSDLSWAPDGRSLAFVGKPARDEPHSDVKVITRVRYKHDGEGFWDGRYKHLFPVSVDNACMNATNTDVWIASAGGGDPVNLTAAADRSFEHHIITDMRAHPEIGGPVWSADGQRIFAIVAEGAMNQLAAVDARGAGVTVLISGRREIFGLAIGGSGGRAVVAASDPATPGDLWVVPLDGRAAERRLTQVNQAILDQVILSVPERFTYQGADDWPVEGWVMRPVEFRDGARYPTVLQIHGGPHGAYGEAFFHEFQLLAAEGFAVVYTNPRGSQGYGQQFTAATHHDWGGKDCEDILRGLDQWIARFPFIDPDRLGVAGGSHGGFITNWVIGHTDRFKAAVSMRSISNNLSQWGTSDLAFMKGVWEFPGDPWDAPTWYWEHSPLAYVERITTPLLILHSEQDLRCPIEEAEQLFAALRKLRRDVVFVRFPNESHDLSRIGQPRHRVERLHWVVKWLADHLRQPAAPVVREPAVAGGTAGAPNTRRPDPPRPGGPPG